jgi:hypothetical protein
MPYSSVYSTVDVSQGSLPGLRTGMKPAPICRATAPPRMKPRASAAATTSTSSERAYSEIRSIALDSAPGSRSSGVMSLKTIPGLGKSGMSRM